MAATAPTTTPARLRVAALSGWAPWAAAVAVLAALSALALGRGALNYDTQWSIGWGAAIARGELPEYDIDAAPTSHPLATFVAALSQLLVGDATPGVFHGLAHLAFAGLLVAAFAVGRRLSGWPAGIAAAAVLALSSPIHMNTAFAFQDVATGALVLLALALVLERPRRGTAPLLVLACAGLLRPEAWGLAAAYWLFCAWGAPRREQVQLAALAALGPGLWMLNDLVVTGEPLLSFTRTREGAEVALRETGVSDGPRLLFENVRGVLRLPVLGAAAAGGVLTAAALAWRSRSRAPALVRGALDATDTRLGWPLAVAALLAVAFLAVATGELSLLERYVIPLSGALAILAGHAIAGFTHARPGLLRRLWALFGCLVVVGWTSVLPTALDQTDKGLVFARSQQQLGEQLERLVQSPGGRTALARCPVAGVAGYRMLAPVAYALDRRPGSLRILEDPSRMPRRGVWIAPISRLSADGFGPVTGGGPRPAPPGWRAVAKERDFAVFVRGC